MKIDKRHLLNYSILIPYLILSVLGLIIVYSTTSATLVQSGANSFKSVISQGIFWILSLIAIVFIYKVKIDIFKKQEVLFGFILVEVILLLLSRFITRAVNGAHGWLFIGGVSIQPAEYLKILLVWFLALRFSRKQEEIEIYDYQALTFNRWLPRTLSDWRTITGILIGIVVIMPDLGNATILALTVLIMVSVSGIGHRWFSAMLGILVGTSTLILSSIWLLGVEKVSKVPLFGYVAKNSYDAIVNGGWFGLGLGNSIEKRGYLPEAQTDFVFSIVIEELGFIGASLILALLFFLILRIILVGIRARDPFNSMVALGIGGMMLTQTFINIGGISGLIPSTGVTFPFLSQGGNSLLVLSVGIAFVLNIDANEKRNNINRVLEETL